MFSIKKRVVCVCVCEGERGRERKDKEERIIQRKESVIKMSEKKIK